MKKASWIVLLAMFVVGEANATAPFYRPLPIPTRLVVPKNQKDVTIRLTPLSAKIYPGSEVVTKMWGYNGTSPGPTIEVEKDQYVRIHWKNDLPTKHLLAAPMGMMNEGPLPGDHVVMDGPRSTSNHSMPGMPGMGEGAPSGNLPDVRNVTHLHGAAVWNRFPFDQSQNNDGWPDTWTVPGEEQIASYPNDQDARTLWYHDHAIGETGRNVAAGLVGMYIIRDKFERSLNLPSGKYEIPLILQAVGIKPNGALYYTDQIWNEFYGNAVAVNGKIMPYLQVEPRKYRFRILNASNARMYGLKLVDADDGHTPGPAFHQIGTDSGFLENAVTLNDPSDIDAPLLFLASAERADIIIDFSQWAGKQFVLHNSRSTSDRQLPLERLMLFKVGTKLSKPDTSSLPTHIRTIKRLPAEQVAQTRKIVISEMDHPDGSIMFQLNSRAWFYKKTDEHGTYWDYEIDIKPVAGTSEIWEITNTTGMIHPFHVHPVEFQVLDRRPFDVAQFNQNGATVFTGPALPPDPNELGWKDVVRSYPGEVTRIIMRFGPHLGYYVFHCHLLEHEDMDMMIPYQVVSACSGGTQQQCF